VALREAVGERDGDDHRGEQDEPEHLDTGPKAQNGNPSGSGGRHGAGNAAAKSTG